MRRKFQPFEWKLARVRFLFVFMIVALLTAAVLFVYSAEEEVIWAETTRVGTDKQAIAWSGAQRMETFFERVETDLRILSQGWVLAGSKEQQGRGRVRSQMPPARRASPLRRGIVPLRTSWI